MNYGLYLSATGALTSMHRQAVLSNNLANLNTVGFQPEQAFTRQRLPERVESGSFAEPKWLLERLGGGLLVAPTTTNVGQGALVPTGKPFDVAVEGDGWLVVRSADPADPDGLRLTRDGRFTLNANRELVGAASGRPVMNEQGRTIRLEADAPVQIDDRGSIVQNGRVVDRLRLVASPPGGTLVPAGDGTMRFGDDVTPVLRPAAGHIRQGFTESSAVNAVKTLTDLMSAAKAAQSNLKMMQYHDQTLNQVFNTVGRVA